MLSDRYHTLIKLKEHGNLIKRDIFMEQVPIVAYYVNRTEDRILTFYKSLNLCSSRQRVFQKEDNYYFISQVLKGIWRDVFFVRQQHDANRSRSRWSHFVLRCLEQFCCSCIRRCHVAEWSMITKPRSFPTSCVWVSLVTGGKGLLWDSSASSSAPSPKAAS